MLGAYNLTSITFTLFGSHASASRDSRDKLIHCSDNLLVFEVIAEVGHLQLASPGLLRDPGSKTFITQC